MRAYINFADIENDHLASLWMDISRIILFASICHIFDLFSFAMRLWNISAREMYSDYIELNSRLSSITEETRTSLKQ